MNRRQVLRATTAVGATAASATGALAGTRSARASAGGATGPLRVHVVMFDGVEELDFAAPYEVFSAAGFFTSRPVEVRYVSATGARSVTAAYGTTVRDLHRWAPDEADLLVVPGGGYARRDSPGVWAETDRGVLPRALAAASSRPGLTLGALCTGVMLLAAAGLTRGRPCTTHHRAKADLERRGGLVKNARVVDDGDLVTAGGITSGLELALWLTRRELGSDTATALEAMLEYEARGTVWTSRPAA
ncbi:MULTISPECIES: DJ-1/PfpI family protein [Streptomyces]|uniref:AraC family transcriptional regulator n=1 Tax=Streptomyces viridochromogenes TaxID=1938 RepID=A0A0L8JK78_STRVR|nr:MULTISPECIES: DJ-1/PfpI family protein [Streptomyces]KOG13994.1 AraC family transcriptional regulator [Streptomyces viridochromogenes]